MENCEGDDIDSTQKELPLNALFGCSNISEVAQLLQQQSKVEDKGEVVDWDKEVQLDKAILDDLKVNLRNYSATSKPQQILLTGCTGFLGAFLLYGMLFGNVMTHEISQKF